MENSFNDLPNCIAEKFSDKNNKCKELKATLSNEPLKSLKIFCKKKIVKGKKDQLCQDKSLLQEQISELKKQNRAIAALCEETEQHSRRLCRIDRVPSVDRETCSDVLEKAKKV